MTSILPDDAGGYSSALQETLGGPVACFTLYAGIQLWCNRDGLVAGLMLIRHVLDPPSIEPERFEARNQSEGWKWTTKGDFLLARSGERGEPADLTESDIEHCMFWLGLDYILPR
ncbi:MAG TPA: hypothetical protein VF469_30205 [Kofleriaceae bacterium]